MDEGDGQRCCKLESHSSPSLVVNKEVMANSQVSTNSLETSTTRIQHVVNNQSCEPNLERSHEKSDQVHGSVNFTPQEDVLMMMADEEDDLDSLMNTFVRNRKSVNTSLHFSRDVDSCLDSLHFEQQCQETIKEFAQVSLNDRQIFNETSTSSSHNDYSSPDQLALLVAVDEYMELEFLQTAQEDCLLVHDSLSSLGYDPIETMINDEVTQESIIRSLKAIDHRTMSRDSKFVFHFSGHGEKGLGLCLPYFSRDDPQATSMSFESLLTHMPKTIHQILIILDCCHSSLIEELKYNQKILSSIPRYQVIHIVCSTTSPVAIEDNFNGLFTSSLCRALRYSSAWRDSRVSFRSLYEEIRNDVERLSRKAGIVQTPLLFSLSHSRRETNFLSHPHYEDFYFSRS